MNIIARTMLAAAIAATLGAATAEASGSIGSGSGKMSAREAYSQGKFLVFRELVCAGCPLGSERLDRTRAQALAEGLVAVHERRAANPNARTAAAALCRPAAVDGPEECTTRLAAVHYYLQRRYRL